MISIHVLIASDIRLYREGLSEVLGRCGSLLSVGEAEDAQACLALVARLLPEVLLLDLNLPDSAEVIRVLALERSQTRVVAIGVADDAAAVCACAETGVAGFVPRSAGVDDLVASIHAVMRDELHCSPRMAAMLFRRRPVANTERTPPLAELTAREWQIAERLVRGLSNKEIANELSIELSTVKNHVHHMLEKLHARHRGEVAALLRRHLLPSAQ